MTTPTNLSLGKQVSANYTKSTRGWKHRNKTLQGIKAIIRCIYDHNTYKYHFRVILYPPKKFRSIFAGCNMLASQGA